MKVLKASLLLINTLILFTACGQVKHTEFTRDDTLRGSITPERIWWDLKYYELRIKVNPSEKSLAGSTAVFYEVLKPYQTLQIDLNLRLPLIK